MPMAEALPLSVTLVVSPESVVTAIPCWDSLTDLMVPDPPTALPSEPTTAEAGVPMPMVHAYTSQLPSRFSGTTIVPLYSTRLAGVPGTVLSTCRPSPFVAAATMAYVPSSCLRSEYVASR